MNPVFVDGGDPNTPYIPPSHEVVVKDYTLPVSPVQANSNLSFVGIVLVIVFGALIFYVAYKIMIKQEETWHT